MGAVHNEKNKKLIIVATGINWPDPFYSNWDFEKECKQFIRMVRAVLGNSEQEERFLTHPSKIMEYFMSVCE
jgi:hypothetical protein